MRFSPVFIIPFLLLPATGCGDRPESVSTEVRSERFDAHSEKTRPLCEDDNNGHHPLLRRTDQTPEEVLRKMVSTYRSAETYSDRGMIRIVGQVDRPGFEPIPWPCTIAYRQPGFLRMEINDGVLVSNGERCFAQIRSLPDQVLTFPSPTPPSPTTWFRDIQFDQAAELGLPETVLRIAPQLILLFADDPMKTFVPDGATTEFLDPQWIKEIPCDLIRVSHPGGNRILWIGRDVPLLLRFDYLVEGLPVPEGFESIRLIRIDLTDAAVNLNINREAFEMLQPEGARHVDEFQPPEFQLLGNIPKDFKSFHLTPIPNPPPFFRLPKDEKPEPVSASDPGDNASISSAAISPTSISFADLSEKTIALCFWTGWSESSRAALKEMVELRNTFQDDDRIRCFAVSLDRRYPARNEGDRPPASDPTETADLPTVGSPAISGLSSDPSVLSVYDDRDGILADSFHIDAFPTWIVLAPKGRTEFYFRGLVPESVLAATIRDILSGGKPHENTLSHRKALRETHRRILDSMEQNDYYAAVLATPPPSVPKKPSEPKLPEEFSLEERWVRQDLTSPGNIALLPQPPLPDGTRQAPWVLVPCDGNNLLILDISGRILYKGKPKGLSDDELLTTVRTSVDGIGKRYIGLASISGQVIHVYDERFEPVLSYKPQRSIGRSAAMESRSTLSGIDSSFSETARAVIADFQFADIYGNGTQALLLGILGQETSGTNAVDEILAIDLEGKEIWRDNTVVAPYQVDSFVQNGKRGVFSLDHRENRGSLLRFDDQGKRLHSFRLQDDSQVVWFRVADMDGDGQSELAAILADRDGTSFSFAVLNDEGICLARHLLPYGEYQKPIDQILTGNLTGNSFPEWIVPTPDGTIFVFDYLGKPIDSFALGEFPSGLAVVVDNERRFLIVADQTGLTSWEILPIE